MSEDAFVERAESNARTLVTATRVSAPAFETPLRRIVIGDPQASLRRFFSVLASHNLLSDEGWLLPSVQLVSVGDHFDWGTPSERELAAADGLALLGWLAAHDAKQVTLIAGNHDLGRVGELASFSEEEFLMAHKEAGAAYRGGSPDAELQTKLLARYPQLPTAEIAARDFSAFAIAQRELVQSLLLTGRFRLTAAIGPSVMVCHAGLTTAELQVIGYRGEHADAAAIAKACNQYFDRAIADWNGSGRLVIDGLHRPGDASFGEGGGMLYHRPANLEVTGDAASYQGESRRRYDPRTLPLGLTQVVGHISDAKCRSLFGPWSSGPSAKGKLRYLTCEGEQLRYQTGNPSPLAGPAGQVRLVFVDGGMSRTAPEDYEVLDLGPA